MWPLLFHVGQHVPNMHFCLSRGSLGLSWGSLGALLGSLGAVLGSQNRPKQTQSWGPSEISEILTTPTWELHFRPFMGLSLGSFGALLGSLGGLLDSFGALLGLSWLVCGFSWAHLCFLEALVGYTWCSRALLGSLGALLGFSWPLWGLSWALLGF